MKLKVHLLMYLINLHLNQYKLSLSAIDLFSEEHIDELKIYYSHYVSVLENKPSVKQVLPLSQEDSSQGQGQMSSYEFEPDKDSILRVILPQYVESLIYGTILDAKASEHAARMTEKCI